MVTLESFVGSLSSISMGLRTFYFFATVLTPEKSHPEERNEQAKHLQEVRFSRGN